MSEVPERLKSTRPNRHVVEREQGGVDAQPALAVRTTSRGPMNESVTRLAAVLFEAARQMYGSRPIPRPRPRR